MAQDRVPSPTIQKTEIKKVFLLISEMPKPSAPPRATEIKSSANKEGELIVPISLPPLSLDNPTVKIVELSSCLLLNDPPLKVDVRRYQKKKKQSIQRLTYYSMAPQLS